MLGPQTEIEIRLWCHEFRYVQKARTNTKAMAEADALVADYRARYGLQQPAADDRLGRAAIEAMEMMTSVMGEEIDHADKLDKLDRCIQTYIGRRWHIEKEAGK